MNLLVGTLSMGLILALATLGLYISLRVLQTLDLTVEGSFGLGAALAAALLVRGSSPLAATAAAAAAGVLAGVTSGLMTTRGRIDPLLAVLSGLVEPLSRFAPPAARHHKPFY